MPTSNLPTVRGETVVDLPTGGGYEVNDTETVLEFIRNGLAIGLLPRSLVTTADGVACVAIRDRAPQFQTAIAILGPTPAHRRDPSDARDHQRPHQPISGRQGRSTAGTVKC